MKHHPSWTQTPHSICTPCSSPTPIVSPTIKVTPTPAVTVSAIPAHTPQPTTSVTISPQPFRTLPKAGSDVGYIAFGVALFFASLYILIRLIMRSYGKNKVGL